MSYDCDCDYFKIIVRSVENLGYDHQPTNEIQPRTRIYARNTNTNLQNSNLWP